MKSKIVLDCDPANDDGLAILVAAGQPDITFLAISTVAGHGIAEDSARNAAICAAAAGLTDTPVSAGSAHPLVRDQIVAGILDHNAGLDRRRDDLPAVGLDPRHSVELLNDVFRENPGATLVTTGPLTNLAVAIRQYPEVRANIGRVITLGGAWGLGNKSAAAEFNFLCDPEAASVVFNSGLPITMIPIDALKSVAITPDLLEAIAVIDGPEASFALELLQSLGTTHRTGQGPLAQPQPALLDPVAVLLATDPSLATELRARVDIELDGRFTYGRSVVDFGGKSPDPANANVVIGIDSARVTDAFLTAITALANRERETTVGIRSLTDLRKQT